MMAAQKEKPEGNNNGRMGAFMVLYQELCVLLACIWGAFSQARECSEETYDDLHIALAYQLGRVKKALEHAERQCG